MRDSAAASTITVRLVYLARLREAFGCGGETIALPARDECATVADVLATLAARGGEWASELAPGRAVRVAVNHAMVAPDARVGPGDEVAVFPPVTGG
jgi:molybdopterin synthase sulfur carrier subunit